jgi:hypothetical protein
MLCALVHCSFFICLLPWFVLLYTALFSVQCPALCSFTLLFYLSYARLCALVHCSFICPMPCVVLLCTALLSVLSLALCTCTLLFNLSNAPLCALVHCSFICPMPGFVLFHNALLSVLFPAGCACSPLLSVIFCVCILSFSLSCALLCALQLRYDLCRVPPLSSALNSVLCLISCWPSVGMF